MKLEKRKQERDQAWKVINENQEFKQKQLIEKEKEKERESKIMEEYNKMLEL